MCTLGAATTSVLAVAYLALRLWVPLAAAALLVSLLFGALWGLRRGLAVNVVANFGIGAASLAIAVPYLGAPTRQGEELAWYAIVPQLAVLLLGQRAGIRWALVAMAEVVLAVVLHPYLPHAPLEGPDYSEWLNTFRTLLLIPSVMLFGLYFERERERAQTELHHANRATNAFLASMSHEIRTPMNGVLGMTEVMLQGTLDDETRDRLALIQRSGQTLVALINDILDFSKVEAGKLKIESTDFDLLELMEDLQRLFEPVAQQKGVTLDLSTMSGVPRLLRGDALRLRQVLSNLVNNAVKFTERGTVSLRVVTREQSGPQKLKVEFAVEDTGIGIAPEVVPKLFTLFEQGDASTTRRYGGTGLGLALSRQLVVLMGGTLEVESRVGVGSRFTFSLWLERGVQALVEASPRARPEEQTLVNPVLVVDDNAINLRVACSLLNKAGYSTDTATNGLEALEKVQAHPYSMVLMDCHMPTMDGFEATERIRGLEGDVALIPIIALTASALPEELEACRRAGMNECLTKPVSMKMLQRVISQVNHFESIMLGKFN